MTGETYVFLVLVVMISIFFIHVNYTCCFCHPTSVKYSLFSIKFWIVEAKYLLNNVFNIYLINLQQSSIKLA